MAHITSTMRESSAANAVKAVLHDRVIGALVGSALGDAIGLYTEFLTGAESVAAYPSRQFSLHPSSTPFHQDAHRAPNDPGDWTDDTDHALLILLSILHNFRTANPLSTADFAARLKIWVDNGLRPLETLPLGLGALVAAVVGNADFIKDPERVARTYWEARGRYLAPNGSLMRTHPLGLATLDKSEEKAFEVGAAFSRVTHADPRCVISCAIGTALVRALVRGELDGEADVDSLVARGVQWFTRTSRADRDLQLDGPEMARFIRAESLADLHLDKDGEIGYVYRTPGSGVLLLRMAMRRRERNGGADGLLAQCALFEELITDLIMCGGDADTNACFAGALLGAYLGYKALPDHWKLGLNHGKWFMEKTEGLCYMLQIAGGTYNPRDDVDTLPDGGRGLLSAEQMSQRWQNLGEKVREKGH